MVCGGNQGMDKGGLRSYWLMSTEFLSGGGDEKALEMDAGDGHTTL